MKEFLQRNFVAVLGVALPLLLIAVVLAVHGISRWQADAPQHPVLYVAFSEHDGQYRFKFPIGAQGRLMIRYQVPESRQPASPSTQAETATLALYDVRAESLSSFVVHAPESLPEAGESTNLDVPGALAELYFRPGAIAPDGYRFEQSGYRSGGLFRELFGGGGRVRDNRLIKDGVAFQVPELDGRRYANNQELIGWVIDEPQ
jgi:hypothetical protein